MTSTQEHINTNNKDINTPLKVCFVCTGNTCRSPMAMAVLNHLGNGNYTATSAGIMADVDSPINDKARASLIKAGINSTADNNYEGHRATQLNMGIMESSDKIVAVGAGHAMRIIQAFPLCASKVTSFDYGITDPYGQSQEVYDKCLMQITEQVKAMFALGE